MEKIDFSTYHVLVIGDVMLDKYIFGATHRISPEAPVPVVDVTHHDARLGGAANVALNISTLGANASIIGIQGDDVAAAEMNEILEKKGIANYCIKDKTRPTTVKTRIIANAQHLLRIDSEEKKNIDIDQIKRLIALIREICSAKSIDYVILQDYNKGVFSKRSIADIVDCLKELQVPYGVDPKFENAALFEGADIYKPNLLEAKQLVGNLELNYDEIALLIKDKVRCNTVVLTLSEKGLFCLTDEMRCKVDTQVKDIIDVCGAGDTVISSFVLARLSGMTLREQAIFANIAAGIVCEKSGVFPIYIDEILER